MRNKKTFTFQANITLSLCESENNRFDIFAETELRSEHLPTEESSFESKIFADKSNFLAKHLADEIQRTVDRLLEAENIRGNWIGNGGKAKRARNISRVKNEDNKALRGLLGAKQGAPVKWFSELEISEFLKKISSAAVLVKGRLNQSTIAAELYPDLDTPEKQFRSDLRKARLKFSDLKLKTNK